MRGHFLRAALAGAVGGGDPWTPTEISPTYWIDATDGSTLTLSGATVTDWADKSGNNYATGLFGSPTYSATGMSTNMPAVALNGTTGRMAAAIAGIVSKQALDLYFVFQSSAAAAPDTNSIILWSYGSFRADKFTGLLSSTGAIAGEYICPFFGGSNRLGSTTYRRPANTAQILSNAVSASGTTLHSNGSAVTLDLASGMTTATNTSPAATGSDSVAVRIGSFWDNGEKVSPACKFGEIIIFDTVQSNTNRQMLEGYLAHKWDLAASLPNDHPYKNAAPTT
jgi:hypothetical protein